MTTRSSKCVFRECDGTGWISTIYPPYGYSKDYGFPHEVVEKCPCTGKASKDFRRDNAMMPFDFLDVKGRDFDWSLYGKNMDKQKKLVNLFISNYAQFEKRSKGLYVYSKTKGSGKTMLSCCIANELIERLGISVKFISVLDYIELYNKKSYGDDSLKEEMREFYDVRLLILDDIGMEIKTDHTKMLLYRLVNKRCGNQTTTIFTSNQKIGDLKLNDAAVDRINKMAIPLEMPEVPIRANLTERENEEFLKELQAQ